MDQKPAAGAGVSNTGAGALWAAPEPPCGYRGRAAGLHRLLERSWRLKGLLELQPDGRQVHIHPIAAPARDHRTVPASQSRCLHWQRRSTRVRADGYEPICMKLRHSSRPKLRVLRGADVVWSISTRRIWSPKSSSALAMTSRLLIPASSGAARELTGARGQPVRLDQFAAASSGPNMPKERTCSDAEHAGYTEFKSTGGRRCSRMQPVATAGEGDEAGRAHELAE